MKKLCLLLCVALILGTLTGCVVEKTDTPSEPEVSTTEAVSKPIVFTNDDIAEMGNAMNGGFSSYSGSWVYGISFSDDGNGALFKVKSDGSEQTRLDKDSPSSIIIEGGWIYYIGYNWSKEESTINRIRISGEDKQVLVKAPDEPFYINTLLVNNGHIYYTVLDESETVPKGRLMQRDLDGKNPVKILNKAVYFPYIIGESLYYQDDNDFNRIHICNLDGNNDRVFINEWVYQFIYDGNYFYYLTYENKDLTEDQIRKSLGGKEEKDVNYKQIIRRCNSEGQENETVINADTIARFIMADGMIFFTNADDNFRLYSYNIETSEMDVLTQDTNVNRLSILGNQISYFDYLEDENVVDNIYIVNFDGTYKNPLFDVD